MQEMAFPQNGRSNGVSYKKKNASSGVESPYLWTLSKVFASNQRLPCGSCQFLCFFFVLRGVEAPHFKKVPSSSSSVFLLVFCLSDSSATLDRVRVNVI